MKVAILGGTGLVGTEMISILAERKFPVTELIVFASTRSEGKTLSTPSAMSYVVLQKPRMTL